MVFAPVQSWRSQMKKMVSSALSCLTQAPKCSNDGAKSIWSVQSLCYVSRNRRCFGGADDDDTSCGEIVGSISKISWLSIDVRWMAWRWNVCCQSLIALPLSILCWAINLRCGRQWWRLLTHSMQSYLVPYFNAEVSLLGRSQANDVFEFRAWDMNGVSATSLSNLRMRFPLGNE